MVPSGPNPTPSCRNQRPEAFCRVHKSSIMKECTTYLVPWFYASLRMVRNGHPVVRSTQLISIPRFPLCISVGIPIAACLQATHVLRLVMKCHEATRGCASLRKLWEWYEHVPKIVWTCCYCIYLDCDQKLIEDVLGYIDQDVWAKQVTPKALYPCLWKHQEADEYDSNLIQFSSIILWFILVSTTKKANLQFFVRPGISNQLFQHVFSS